MIEKGLTEGSLERTHQNFVRVYMSNMKKRMTRLSSTITSTITNTFTSFYFFLSSSRRWRSQRLCLTHIPCFPKWWWKTHAIRERERSLELPLLHLFNFLLIMLMSIKNGKNHIHAPTKRIELAMCNKLVVIFSSSSLIKICCLHFRWHRPAEQREKRNCTRSLSTLFMATLSA